MESPVPVARLGFSGRGSIPPVPSQLALAHHTIGHFQMTFPQALGFVKSLFSYALLSWVGMQVNRKYKNFLLMEALISLWL